MEFLAGGRAEVRITHADVGKRVSVRRLTGGGSGEPAFTDAVGVLTSWTDGVLSITRRGGECVRIEESSLVAGKVVPAAPARRRGPAATVRELQEVAARSWPALETERLGQWTLRASEGFTRRANSVLALGDPGVPLTEALGRVARWYAARGLPALLTVPTGGGSDEGPGAELAAGLAARGWTDEAHTTVRTAPLAPLADAAADTARVLLSREPDAGWLSLYHRTGAAPSAAARAVLTGGPSVWFARVPAPDGTPAAIGRLAVDGRWAGFSAVETAPERRRGGLATLVMAALAGQALAEGASAAYLQVEADNAGALALYGRLGFTEHHGYHYRRGPGPGAAGA
ncbi:GNAT family N-acetyltransferase [Streptomyces sp. RS10V-4]|uniref:GNAT family N-acetyltransferase n=1 Tax=Streptomyces rhizoryzae TaxID=2932493 RepID=UPI002005CAF5|nr:GNAT family N-acetyltransferase [Streptomyces rhizoryzae]MCK7624134.1 GNAT family N-acetyltransferase [Streptomyces rhizoryzae]